MAISPFQIFGAFLSIQGRMQAGREESRRQAAIAAQQEQNKRFEQLRALQEHNARVEAFRAYESTTNTVRAINMRSSDDRSIRALMKAGKEKSMEDIDRARTQSLFTQARMQFAADDARRAGAFARQQALMSSAQSIATMGYQMEQVTPTETG